MPSKTKKQSNFMAMACANPSKVKVKKRVSRKVACEYARADKRGGHGKKK